MQPPAVNPELHLARKDLDATNDRGWTRYGLEGRIQYSWLQERLSRAMALHLLVAFGALGVGLAGLFAGWINLRLRLGIEEQDRFVTFVSLAGAVLFFALRVATFAADEPLRPCRRAFLRDLGALGLALAVFLAVAYIGRIGALFSRGWMLSWFLLAILALALVRFLLVGLFAPLARRRLALLGSPELVAAAQRLLEEGREEAELVAAVAADGGELEKATARLATSASESEIDEIVLCLALADAGAVRRTVDSLLAVPAEVSLFADRSALVLVESGVVTTGLPRLRLLERPLRDWGRLAKGLFDRLAAALLLVLLAPLFGAIALAIRLDSPGPVFYRQLRYGRGRRPFMLLKFRSMYVQACDAPDAPIRQAQRDDPRVTRIGRWLRRLSLDELPQLLNVLRGEMSLVGPRPHPVRMDDHFAECLSLYLARHRLKPGITGWAQIHGLRGETATAEAMAARLAYDLYYLRNWSFALDLWILFRTPWELLRCRNAY